MHYAILTASLVSKCSFGDTVIISRVVIVHNYHDDKRCRCLVKSLRAVGYDVWYKRWGWLREKVLKVAMTRRVLPEGDAYLLLISDASWSSEQWHKAILEALAKNKTVLPLLYEPTKIEGFLDLHHYLNVVGLDCNGVSRRVIGELELITVNKLALPPAALESITP